MWVNINDNKSTKLHQALIYTLDYVINYHPFVFLNVVKIHDNWTDSFVNRLPFQGEVKMSQIMQFHSDYKKTTTIAIKSVSNQFTFHSRIRTFN